MSTFYKIEGTTANGDLLSQDMSPRFERGYISVTFYTDSTLTSVVTPTAGTLTFTASETKNGYGTISSGTLDATADPYPRPNFSGGVASVKATAAGITGAGHYVAIISRYGG